VLARCSVVMERFNADCFLWYPYVTYSSPTSYDSPRTPDVNTNFTLIGTHFDLYNQPHMNYFNIFYYNCDLSYINTDLLKKANVILSFDFIYPFARHNILIAIVNIVGIPTCIQHLST
jgi:hypothetical protein